METLFAVLGFAFGFLTLQLGYFAGLQRGRSERGAEPLLISAIPITTKVRYTSSEARPLPPAPNGDDLGLITTALVIAAIVGGSL